MPVLNKMDPQAAARLDAFLRSRDGAYFFQSFAWAEEKSNVWTPEFVWCEEAGQITAAALLLVRKLAPGLTFMYCPRGPVADLQDPAQIRALLREAQPLLKKYKPFTVKFDPPLMYDDGLVQAYRKAGFRVETEFPDILAPMSHTDQMIVRIGGLTEEQVMAKFAARTRYSIRSAYKMGVTTRHSRARADVETFYQLMLETGRRQEIPVRSYDHFENLLKYFGDRARIYLAEYEGECVAAALAIWYGKRVSYFYGGSSEANRKTGGSYALQLEMIRWGLETGCREFDMGSILSREPTNGLFCFKNGFCKQDGITQYIGEIDLVRSRLKYLVYRKGIPLAKKMVMRLKSGR